MTTTTVWTAFVSFMADRTTPKTFVSDNGAQFHCINNNINNFWSIFHSDPDVTQRLQNQNVEWIYRPAHAPWYGGIYERIVGIIKDAFYKIHSKFPVLQEVLYQTIKNLQIMVNHRPLCPTSDTDFDILTPTHFLNIDLTTTTPHLAKILDPQYEKNEKTPNQPVTFHIQHIYKHVQLHTKKLWEAWHRLYLLYLRDKQPSVAPTAYRTTSKDIKPGDLVHVLDQKSQFGTYTLARIITLADSHDNQPRQAFIELPSGHFTTRPFQNLAPLELHSEVEFIPPQKPNIEESNTTQIIETEIVTSDLL